MDWLFLVGIALANNLDNTGVGVAYGIGRIRLPPLINLWISAVTFVITATATALGDHLTHYLPPHLTQALGAVILCGIGMAVMLPSLRKARQSTGETTERPRSGEHPHGPSLGDVLADPAQADRDGSRHIDFSEATLLALALSINNVGGGVSAGLLHLSVLWTALLSAAFSFVVLWFGGWAGRQWGTARLGGYAQTAAGTLLILLGLFQLRGW